MTLPCCWIGISCLLVAVMAEAQPDAHLEKWRIRSLATVQLLSKPEASIPGADADAEAAMKPYTERIRDSKATFEMIPIRGGTFGMGSPENEPGRKPDEGPRHEVRLEPFWMGKCEVTWNEFDVWVFALDIEKRKIEHRKPTPKDDLADLLTYPSEIPYWDSSIGVGKDGYPAIGMSQFAAKMYCRWLSAKTGRYYRLPTEAEWEYACRAGTNTAYSLGNDPKQLDAYAWSASNSDDKYHPVGRKKPNPWGLYDMHGNVAEWVLDGYLPDCYRQPSSKAAPFTPPKAVYPRVARGGSWMDDPEELRSAARRKSNKEWSLQDPGIPASRFWHTDATFVGFRVVRPLRLPSPEECRRLEGLDREKEFFEQLDRDLEKAYHYRVSGK